MVSNCHDFSLETCFSRAKRLDEGVVFSVRFSSWNTTNGQVVPHKPPLQSLLLTIPFGKTENNPILGGDFSTFIVVVEPWLENLELSQNFSTFVPVSFIFRVAFSRLV